MELVVVYDVFVEVCSALHEARRPLDGKARVAVVLFLSLYISC